jgi:hypothetical protein
MATLVPLFLRIDGGEVTEVQAALSWTPAFLCEHVGLSNGARLYAGARYLKVDVSFAEQYVVAGACLNAFTKKGGPGLC